MNIKALPGLGGITFDAATGLDVGALATLAELASHPAVREHYPALPEALAVTATPQLRNMATVAGNLLQRPRCWYFRHRDVPCWLKGGDGCPLQYGENRFGAIVEQSRCWAVHPSDLAPILLALDAEALIYGRRGERRLALSDLFRPPDDLRRTETVLSPDELMLSVHIPAPAPGTRMTYLKAMDRKIWAFALAGVAVVLRLDGETIQEARIVLSGVANVPLRALAAEEALTGGRADPSRIERAANAAVDNATPLRDNGYKVPLVKSLVARALAALTG
jgi:xanthine dehydrogenase YagS FAD-binding subunit